MDKKKKKPTDINQLAASIVDQVTGRSSDEQAEQPAEDQPKEKNPAAVALGRLGGLKGGKARAAKLSPSQRKEIARQAAQKRWSKD